MWHGLDPEHQASRCTHTDPAAVICADLQFLQMFQSHPVVTLGLPNHLSSGFYYLFFPEEEVGAERN